MMDFTHIDAHDWPVVRHKGRSMAMRLGVDYVDAPDGIHLTVDGMFRLGSFTDDIDLMTMAIARGAKAFRSKVDLEPHAARYRPLSPERAAGFRRMHEEGER